MSGRGRLALCAFAATLMAAGALVPLVKPAGWLFQAAVMVALVSTAGAAGRRVPLARALTVVLQAVLVLLLLTLVFARKEAFLGLVPTPDVFAEFSRLLSAGGDDVGRFAIPAPATQGIKLMLIGGVLVIGLAVDAIAVTFRSAAPAGLPLLALYSVAAGLSGGAGGALWFLLAACGYLLLLLAEGRDRLSQWGRVFGGAPRPGHPPQGATAGTPPPVRTGRRIGVAALGVALVVPLALPALDGGLLGGTGPGTGTGSGGGGTISAVNPLVSLQDNLNQPEDREALRYRTNAPDNADLYLRIMALDKFDGTSWRFSQRSIEDVPSEFPTPQGLEPDVTTTEIRTSITAAPWYRQDYLPMPYPATKVKIDSGWRYEPTGRTLVGERGQSTRGERYEVTSLLVDPTRTQLADAPAPPAALRAEYTQVPANLPSVVKRTAQDVTAGATNNYERAVRLQDWFAVEGGFRYDVQVDSGTGITAITRFLRDKEGFCVHFSFTMAAMARTLGIPARVAVGFTPGTKQANGTVSVGLRDAHAWPELYFEGVGWTRFEPTPSRGSTPQYTRPDTPSGSASDPELPDAATSAEPSTAPSASASCDAQSRRLDGCGSAAPGATTPPDDPDDSMWAALPVVGLILGGAVLLFLPLLPLVGRERLRSRRLGSGGRTASDVTARTLAAWREIIDTAWDYGIPPDDSQTPRKAAARIALLGKLEGEAAAAVHRVASSVEQVLYAPLPRPGTGLAEDARRVHEGLRAPAGRGARLRALLAPRSSIRVIWALSDRWAAHAARWAAHRLHPSRWAEAVRRRPSRQEG